MMSLKMRWTRASWEKGTGRRERESVLGFRLSVGYREGLLTCPSSEMSILDAPPSGCVNPSDLSPSPQAPISNRSSETGSASRQSWAVNPLGARAESDRPDCASSEAEKTYVVQKSRERSSRSVVSDRDGGRSFGGGGGLSCCVRRVTKGTRMSRSSMKVAQNVSATHKKTRRESEKR